MMLMASMELNWICLGVCSKSEAIYIHLIPKSFLTPKDNIAQNRHFINFG